MAPAIGAIKNFKPVPGSAWIVMPDQANPCLYEVNEEFLSYVEDFLKESDLGERVRKLSRAEGYLRYLFFELVGNLKDWKGGDLRTLVCGLSYLIPEALRLCYQAEDGVQETACSIVRDLIDLTFSLMRRWKESEEVKVVGSELWTMLDPEKGLADEEEAESLALRLSTAISSLLS